MTVIQIQIFVTVLEHIVTLKREFIVITICIMSNFDLNHPLWLSAMNEFASAKTYCDRLVAINVWLTACIPIESQTPANFLLNLINYFDTHHSLLLESGEHQYSATTMRSWYSMIKKYFTMVGLGALDTLLPQLNDSLGKWEKLQTVKKARVFEKEEMARFMAMPHTAETLVIKAYAVADVSYSGRSVETSNFQMKNLKRMTDDVTDKGYYSVVGVSEIRAKGVGTTSEERPHLIMGNIFHDLNYFEDYCKLY